MDIRFGRFKDDAKAMLAKQGITEPTIVHYFYVQYRQIMIWQNHRRKRK